MDATFLTLSFSCWLGVIAVILIACLSPGFRNRPPLVFKYPQRERNTALIYLALLALLSAALTYITPDWIQDLPAQFSTRDWTLAIFDLLAVLIAFLLLQYRKQPLLSFGWHRKLWKPASRLGIALVFLAVFLSGSVSRITQFLTGESLLNLLLLILIYLFRETALRGYLQPRLSAWLGETWGWLAASTAAFLLLLPMALSLGASTEFIFRLAGNQLILGWMMKRCGHIFPGALWAATTAWLTLVA